MRGRTVDNVSHYLRRELVDIFRRETDFFSLIDQYVVDGFWYWNLETPEEGWLSPNFWRTLGYTPDDDLQPQTRWQTLIHPEDLESSRSNVAKHCEDPNIPYDQIVRYTHKNGEVVWLRCRGFALRDAHGRATRMFGIHTNVSRTKQMEERYKKIITTMDRVYADLRVALEESEQLFESMPDAVLQVDHEGDIVKSNSQASLLFGYSPEQLRELKVESLVPEQSRGKHLKFRAAFQQAPDVREMGGESANLTALTQTGRILFVDIRLSPIQTKYGTQTIAVIRDVTERKKLQEKIKQQEEEEQKLFKLSSTDALTGLLNRGYFMELANRALRQAERYNHPFCVMMLDIDDFKGINDQFGHAEGDRALKQVGGILKSSIRETDIIGRIGGEEFAIVMPESSLDQGVILADKILFNVEDARSEATDGTGQGHCPTVSIGLAVRAKDTESFSEILYHADQMLYKAKASGKARVVYAS